MEIQPQMPVEPQPGAIMSQAKGVFDNLKTPVFWLAAGYALCKILDRKRKITI